jgi:small subunit ribosomal protein S16
MYCGPLRRLDSHTIVAHNNGNKRANRGMVKIRLRRVGAKKKQNYRVVVADARAPRDGAFIATIGHFNPLTDPETVVINEEEALRWLRQGAQPTATAARLLSKLGIMEKFETSKEKT